MSRARDMFDSGMSYQDIAEGFESEIETLTDKNAKLREYVRMLAKATVYGPCEWCQYDGDGTCGTETDPMRDGCKLYAELRLMGVAVDQWQS